MIDQNRIYILNDGKDLYWLSNISINEDRKKITALINPIPDQIRRPSKVVSWNSSLYSKTKPDITQQVHIYAEDYFTKEDSEASIPFTSICKMEIYEMGTDGISWNLSGTYDFANAVAFLNIIVSHEKYFCPFIYAHNGEKYAFAGEILGGATKPGLERYDYMYLPDIKPYNNHYLIKVANEVREIQYINLMQLRVIDHPDDVKVLIDKYGRLQTLSEPKLPKSAVTYSGRDILPIIIAKDNFNYNFDEINKIKSTTDGIILTWDKP